MYQVISIILFIAVIALAVLYFTKTTDGKIVQKADGTVCELEGVGIVDAEILSGVVDPENPSEMKFNYLIYNYGDSKAKDVVVRCDLWDEEGKEIVFTTRDNFGDLDSSTTKTGEVSAEYSPSEEAYYIPLCYVESCDNCEILYKRIPELVEEYEG